MRRSIRLAGGVVIPLLIAATATAATFVVPSDRAMVGRAHAIVVASPLESHSRKTEGVIETVTTLSIDEVIKGRIEGETLEVVGLGGRVDDEEQNVPGIPTFRAGEHVLLFLNRTPRATWAVTDLVLGKFALAMDDRGRAVAVRQETDINGWNVSGQVHDEPVRSAEKFLAFVRSAARGEAAIEDYYLPRQQDGGFAKKAASVESNSIYTAASYLFASKPRWNTFPQTFYTGTANVTGAPGNGVTGSQDALAIWTNDATSNVSYQYGGSDTTHTNGVLGASDGVNSILFERDLTSQGAPAFKCAEGGVLGIGTIRFVSTLHPGPDGVDYRTAVEGDVEMNQGIAGCSWVVSGAVWKNALTHELGHSLGFRHADENPSGGSCDPATMECVPSPQDPDSGPHAVMRSSIAGSLPFALQTYDIDAVGAVYPQPVAAAPAAPTNVQAIFSSETGVFVSWSGSDGATSYAVWRSDAGGSYTNLGSPTPNPAATSFLDTTASANSGYFYQVEAHNASGSSPLSGADVATTIVYTDPTLSAGMTAKAAHLTELRTAANLMKQLTGSVVVPTYTDPTITPGTTVITAEHFQEVENFLLEARTSLGMSVPAPLGFAAGGAIRASDISTLRTYAQ